MAADDAYLKVVCQRSSVASVHTPASRCLALLHSKAQQQRVLCVVDQRC